MLKLSESPEGELGSSAVKLFINKLSGVFAMFTILKDSVVAPLDDFVALIFKLLTPPSPSILYPPAK